MCRSVTDVAGISLLRAMILSIRVDVPKVVRLGFVRYRKCCVLWGAVVQAHALGVPQTPMLVGRGHYAQCPNHALGYRKQFCWWVGGTATPLRTYNIILKRGGACGGEAGPFMAFKGPIEQTPSIVAAPLVPLTPLCLEVHRHGVGYRKCCVRPGFVGPRKCCVL